MPLTQDVVAAAPELAAEVVRDWASFSSTFGWKGMETIDEDHLAELICRLAEAALARDTRKDQAAMALIRAAIKHGMDRRDDGFNEDMLFREYHLLRRGLWKNLKGQGSELAAETILRIDGEITMATAASLRGFHLEGGEVDEALVRQIVMNWST